MSRKVAVFIDGGLGRVLCAIPAVIELSKQVDTIIISHGWDEAYTGCPIRVIDANNPTLELHLSQREIIKPEPYWRDDFRQGEVNLVEAFCRELRVKPKEHIPFKTVTLKARNVMNDHIGKPSLLLQPHGSGGSIDGRSLSVSEILAIKEKYSDTHRIIAAGIDKEYVENYRLGLEVWQGDLLDFIKLVQEVDEFIGCDSSGIHIRASCKKQHTLYSSVTAGIKYYPTTKNIIKEGYTGSKFAPRL